MALAGRRAVPAPALMGAILVLALIGVSCSSLPPLRPDRSAGLDDSITVASFDFPESVLLAQIYGQALRSHGYRVRYRLELGAREFVDPALARGLVELVPEYSGAAAGFFAAGHPEAGPGDAADEADALQKALAGTGLVALTPSPAEDANVIVVTQETAVTYGLASVSDLKRVDGKLRFGGPPECPERPLCLIGLERRYGLHFREFDPLDSGGPLTVSALESGGIDVALLFSTDPVIQQGGLVVLRDDLHLQPAQNVTPVVRAGVLRRWGPGLRAVIDEVSLRLTTDGLQRLNGEVRTGEDPGTTASEWLAAMGSA